MIDSKIKEMMEILKMTSVVIPHYNQPWPEEIIKRLNIEPGPNTGEFIYYKDHRVKYDGLGVRYLYPNSPSKEVGRLTLHGMYPANWMLNRVYGSIKTFFLMHLRQEIRQTKLPDTLYLFHKLYSKYLTSN